jgi:hypothetical protein
MEFWKSDIVILGAKNAGPCALILSTVLLIIVTCAVTEEASPGSPGPKGEVAAEAKEPEGPTLPEYGGLPGILVHEYGAKMLRLPNPNPHEGVLLPEPSAEAGGKPKPVVLPVAEEAVKLFLGTPHNFDVSFVSAAF